MSHFEDEMNAASRRECPARRSRIAAATVALVVAAAAAGCGDSAPIEIDMRIVVDCEDCAVEPGSFLLDVPLTMGLFAYDGDNTLVAGSCRSAIEDLDRTIDDLPLVLNGEEGPYISALGEGEFRFELYLWIGRDELDEASCTDAINQSFDLMAFLASDEVELGGKEPAPIIMSLDCNLGLFSDECEGGGDEEEENDEKVW